MDPQRIDTAVTELGNHKQEWARLPISEKIKLFEGVTRQRLGSMRQPRPRDSRQTRR
jgi:hypothetical protein